MSSSRRSHKLINDPRMRRLQEMGAKIVIKNRADKARPQSVTLLNSNLKPVFKDSICRFAPPKGAKSIEIVPLKTK